MTAICGTYNRVTTRPKLLDEAVESFLRQSHPEKELILLNDCDGQELIFDHPQVRVINHTRRFACLADKHNFAIGLASGDGICEWDDDDISLPYRLAQASAILEAGYDYFNPGGYFFLDTLGLHIDHPIGYAVNAGAWTRDAWRRAGGVPRIDTGTDAAFDVALHRAGVRIWPGPRQSPKEWAYIYRWGISDLHLSALADQGEAWERQSTFPITKGRFIITPKWSEDYVKLTQEAIK